MENSRTTGPNAAGPAAERPRKESDELDDHDLESVVGGLARAWTRPASEVVPTTLLDEAAY